MGRCSRTACCVLCKCSFRKRDLSGPFIYIQTIWKTSLDCSFMKMSTFVPGKTSFLQEQPCLISWNPICRSYCQQTLRRWKRNWIMSICPSSSDGLMKLIMSSQGNIEITTMEMLSWQDEILWDHEEHLCGFSYYRSYYYKTTAVVVINSSVNPQTAAKAWWIFSNVVTDVLALMHRVIFIHNAD